MLKLSELRQVSRRSTVLAGPRYTPGVDPNAPSIAIDHLREVMDALSLSEGFRSRIQGIHDDLEASLERAKNTIPSLFRRRSLTPGYLVTQARVLMACRTRVDVLREGKRLLRASRSVARHLEDIVQPLRDERYGSDRLDRDRETSLDSKIRDIDTVAQEVNELLDYLTGDPGRALLETNCFLLLGAWGTGKTHFLCDVALSFLAEERPALLMLASALAPDRDPLDAIAEATGLAVSGLDLLEQMSALAKKKRCRALLFVDAINEGDRRTWRKKLRSVAVSVRRYPDIGLVVSCRRPFQETMFSAGARSLFHSLEHYGFQEQELEAQGEFFRYYEIPTPQVPFLNFEFSRPLFLKLMCEALHGLTRRTQRRKLREIGSGQKSMTHVLEHFYKRVGAAIEADFGLPGQSCWRIMKGHPKEGKKGIAGSMAASGRPWLTETEALDAIQDVSELSRSDSASLLRRLVEDGLLIEEVHWNEQRDAVEAFQFSYQRFGDHIIARHLLDEHLPHRDEIGIRRAFYSNRPLGEIFELNRWQSDFRHPGLVAAIMLEFPERVKRLNIPHELIHYLPKRCWRVNVFKGVFLDGLYWRSAESFSRRTDYLIAFLLEKVDEYTRNETLEVLVALASRAGHPYNALRLDGYLRRFAMADLDRVWSEFVRSRDDHSSLHRLLGWIEEASHLGASDEEIENEICLVSLMMTTTARALHDRATRALVQLGAVRPNLLFRETLRAMDFPDSYVPERMLAAAYGVAMRKWADPSGGPVRAALPSFARSLVKKMFAPQAPHPTRHILTRDYALGIIRLARRVSPGCIAPKFVRYLRGDFSHLPTPFVPVEEISPEDVSLVERALHMDFDNYTLGRLVPDRGNYQDDHEGYQDVRKQILRRIRDLGFTSEGFEREDTMIARTQSYGRSNEPGRVDRYGKKYSWIAFFEMYGVRFDAGLLGERRMTDRTSDADVDPSFPQPQRTWKPELPSLFRRAPRLPARWLQLGPTPNYAHLLSPSVVDGHRGPWLLLDGFIREEGSYSREAFTFLRGLFISESRLAALEEKVRSTSYPGNHRIPEAASDYYTYAGEIPWSPQFASYARRADGSARRHIEHAFERFVRGRLSGIRVEVPSHDWAWESYHSVLNETSGVGFPAPALCEFAGLVNYENSFDLRDPAGRIASMYREFEADRPWGDSRLLYMRADLVHEYLESTNQIMVWIPWGERTLHWKEFDRQLPRDIREAMQEDGHVFSDLIVLDHS